MATLRGVDRQPEESEAYLVATVKHLVRGEIASLGRAARPVPGAPLLDLLQYASATWANRCRHNFRVRSGDVRRGAGCADAAHRRGHLAPATGQEYGLSGGQGGTATQRKEQLKEILAELAQLDGLEQLLADVSILPEINTGSESWQVLVHLSRLLPLLAAQLLLVFQREERWITARSRCPPCRHWG